MSDVECDFLIKVRLGRVPHHPEILLRGEDKLSKSRNDLRVEMIFSPVWLGECLQDHVATRHFKMQRLQLRRKSMLDLKYSGD
jgi:hypothetical protein